MAIFYIWHTHLPLFFRFWLFWIFPLEWLGFGFDVIAQRPIIRLTLRPFWANLNRRLTSLTFLERCPCDVKFSNFGTIFSALGFMTKTSVKIAWHEPNDMPTSSATSRVVIRRLSRIIFFTALMFSSVVNVLGQPELASSLTSSRPILNRLVWKLNFSSAHSRRTKRHSQHFQYSCPFFIQNLFVPFFK